MRIQRQTGRQGGAHPFFFLFGESHCHELIVDSIELTQFLGVVVRVSHLGRERAGGDCLRSLSEEVKLKWRRTTEKEVEVVKKKSSFSSYTNSKRRPA